MRKANFGLLLSVLVILMSTTTTLASNPNAMPKSITMETGESLLFKVERIARIAVGDPTIADVKALSGNQLLLMAKSAGGTTVHIKTHNSETSHRITVHPRRTRSIPDEISGAINTPGVSVSIIGDSLALVGSVPTRKQRDDILKIARRYDKEILDMMSVGSDEKQVQIHVRMYEVSKESIKELGIDWKSGTSSGLSGMLSAVTDANPTRAIMDKLRAWVDEGKSKVLAEPTLVTMSGSTASFSSGGEIPIPVVVDGQTTIQWKPYGVSLQVTPKASQDNELLIRVRPEVSSLDWSTTATAGMNLPAVRKRWADVDMKAQSGSSIIMAGLLQKEETRTVSKLPILGDLPIIGELFRSTRETIKETELMVIVTPSIYDSER